MPFEITLKQLILAFINLLKSVLVLYFELSILFDLVLFAFFFFYFE